MREGRRAEPAHVTVCHAIELPACSDGFHEIPPKDLVFICWVECDLGMDVENHIPHIVDTVILQQLQSKLFAARQAP